METLGTPSRVVWMAPASVPPPPGWRNWKVASAKALKMPYQLEVLDIGSTDARVMQISKSGMRSGVLSLPCRYVHSPSEMIDMTDYENTIKLLLDLLSQPVKLG